MGGGGIYIYLYLSISSKEHEICQYLITIRYLQACPIAITTALPRSKWARAAWVSEVASRQWETVCLSRDCQYWRTAINTQGYANVILKNSPLMILSLKYKMDKCAKATIASLTLERVELQNLWFLRSLIPSSGLAGTIPCPTCSRGVYC